MPNPPAADLVGHMHESLRGMRKLIEDIDCAALTAAEAARLYRFFDAAENVAAVLAGRHPASVVNPEVLALERWNHLTPS